MSPPFDELLQNAWNRRAALRDRTSAFRLLNGAASGTPGLAVDCFAGYLVVYAYEADLARRYPGLAEALRRVTGAEGAALKDRVSPDETGRDAGADFFGTVPETVEAAEGPLRFAIHLRHPRNVGLFLDTRPLREMLLSTCSGASVLNLFSYSCSLGAAAAAGGAPSVVNVDVSARYLDWGRENFRLSSLPAERARFTRMDSEEYLDWAARKGHAFDVVILDPPSFSRAKSSRGEPKTFGFEKDYFRLLAKCAARLAPGGRVFAVTNFGGIAAARFRAGVAEALAAAGREAVSLRSIGLPEDFESGAGRRGEVFGPGGRLPGRGGRCVSWIVASVSIRQSGGFRHFKFGDLLKSPCGAVKFGPGGVVVFGVLAIFIQAQEEHVLPGHPEFTQCPPAPHPRGSGGPSGGRAAFPAGYGLGHGDRRLGRRAASPRS